MNKPVPITNFYNTFSKQMDAHGVTLLRIALSIVFIWFGALKVAGMSPAQQLVEKTVSWLPGSTVVPALGAWEMLMGIGLLFKRFIPYTIILLLLHMAFTIMPLLLLTATCFKKFPWCPTLEGQYIIKNLVLVAAILVICGKYNFNKKE